MEKRKVTIQDAFNATWKWHIVDGNPPGFAGGHCKYWANGGAVRCAIGDVEFVGPLTPFSLLQNAHDRVAEHREFRALYRQALADFARIHGLTIPPEGNK